MIKGMKQGSTNSIYKILIGYIILSAFLVHAQELDQDILSLLSTPPSPPPLINPSSSSTILITQDTVLTSDVAGPIIIAADNITLDGAGYTVIGPRTGAQSRCGVELTLQLKTLKLKTRHMG